VNKSLQLAGAIFLLICCRCSNTQKLIPFLLAIVAQVSERIGQADRSAMLWHSMLNPYNTVRS